MQRDEGLWRGAACAHVELPLSNARVAVKQILPMKVSPRPMDAVNSARPALSLRALTQFDLPHLVDLFVTIRVQLCHK